jgi:hypothetical protein
LRFQKLLETSQATLHVHIWSLIKMPRLEVLDIDLLQMGVRTQVEAFAIKQWVLGVVSSPIWCGLLCYKTLLLCLFCDFCFGVLSLPIVCSKSFSLITQTKLYTFRAFFVLSIFQFLFPWHLNRFLLCNLHGRWWSY